MKIAVVAPPWIPVPPADYGGTELVADILCRGFSAAGHDVVLFCSGDSTCPVERRWIIDTATLPPGKHKEHRHFGFALKEITDGDFDIVHCHLEGFLPYAPLLPIPVVCTLHVPVTDARLPILRESRSKLVAVSEDQARSIPRTAAVIHHGIELQRYTDGGAKRQDYLLWLGSVTPEKGLETSISLAKEAGKKLIIAGYLPAEHAVWFEECTRLAGADVSYVGTVNFDEKLALLQRARALLMPVTWREPFGLVALEAMACGTPVIASQQGSLPELIEHGVNGFICDSAQDYHTAIDRCRELESSSIQASLDPAFSASRMVADYLRLFERVLENRNR